MVSHHSWRQLALAAFAVCLVGIFACSDPAGPEDLQVALRLSSNVVSPGDSFTATVVIANPTRRTIDTPTTLPCSLEAIRDGQRVPLQGSYVFCALANANVVDTRVSIAPGDSVMSTFSLIAMLQENQSPWRYIISPPAGSYQVRVVAAGHTPVASFEVSQ